MAIKAKALPRNNGDFIPQDPIAIGTYMARVVRVIDLGVQPQKPWRGEEKPPINMIQITYELSTEFMKDADGNEIEDKPLWKSETLPLYPLDREKAKSTKRYEAIDPKNECKGDFSLLVGRPCMLSIAQNVDKENKVWANISAISQAMRGIPIPELVNKSCVFELDNPDMEVYEAFPDWLKEKIESNLHFENSPLQKALGIKPAPVEEEGGKYDMEAMDDVPF